jgi:hypothetical protein
MTVSCRRSAVAGTGLVEGTTDSIPTGPGLTGSFAPQPPQNLAADGLRLPQAAQGIVTSEPHSRQNRLPAGISAWQLEHFTLAPIYLLRMPPEMRYEQWDPRVLRNEI